MKNNISENIFQKTKGLLNESLDITSPENLVNDSLNFSDNQLVINGEEINNYKKIYVIGFGKASLKMFQGLFQVLGAKYIEKALLVTHISEHGFKFPKTEIIVS